MSDTSHDIAAADDGVHEIHLSGKQLVFLFMATTVVSVIIFLLGVYVGRGVRTEAQPDGFTDTVASAAPAEAPAPQPLPEARRPSAEPPAPPAPQPLPEARRPSAEPPAPPAEAEADEFSYKRRLEAQAPPAESLKPAREPERPQPAPAARTARTASQAAAPASRTPSPVAGTPQAGTWVVQVHALRDRNVANRIVQRLAGKGYPAFLVSAGPPTGTYKVQVGRYRDRSDAERAVERLKKEEQFNPWITR